MAMHSHMVQFDGSPDSYPFGTVDYFDGTCPICEAVACGRKPKLLFVQPAAGVHMTYLSPGERVHRWIANMKDRYLARAA